MSMLGTGGAVPREDFDAVFDLAENLLRGGAYAQALRLFDRLHGQSCRELPVTVNLALCHMAAENWSGALALLDEALGLAKRLPPSPQPPLDEICRRLLARQVREGAHRSPMPKTLPGALPGYAREIVQLLLLEVCVRLELIDRVRALEASLMAVGYPINDIFREE